MDEKPRWWLLLDAAVSEAGGDYVAVGRRLGRSRAFASTLHRGCYTARTHKAEALILDRLGRFHCPGLGEEITQEDCADWQSRECHGTNHVAVAMYVACRRCPRFQGVP